MARGWESKAVEDQIRSAEDEQQEPKKQPILTAEGRDRYEQREGLLLSRARVLADLEAVQNPRHRALLEHTLAYINAELEATR